MKKAKKAFDVLDSKLDLLGDIKHIYTESDILQKSEPVNMVFNGDLYFE